MGMPYWPLKEYANIVSQPVTAIPNRRFYLKLVEDVSKQLRPICLTSAI